MATSQLELGDVHIEVRRKQIKNLHLSVHPPDGHVTISAPSRMQLDKVRVFAISKLDWIKRERKKILAQPRESKRQYIERESHYLWGKRYLLSIKEANQKPSVELKHKKLILTVRPNATAEKRQQVIDEWYRAQLKEALPKLISKWEKKMGVEVADAQVWKMKTKWGSCTPKKRKIRINLELAKKPIDCLEYIVVHEMAHLKERTHNKRFVKLLDTHLPSWRALRDSLNKLPI